MIKIGNNSKIIFQDNQEGTAELEPESVHLTVTSPPYWNLKEYAGGGSGTEDKYEHYISNIEKLFSKIYRATCEGGKCVINTSNIKSRTAVEGKSFLYPIISDTVKSVRKAGFTFFDEAIWVKTESFTGQMGKPVFGSYPYPSTPKLLNAQFENILIFKKEGKRESPAKKYKEESKLTRDEWFEWTRGIWRVNPDRNTGHPATFPVEIPTRIIRLYSFVGDTVLDPYAGTGTSIIIAEKYDRHGIGFEIAESYRQVIQDKSDQHLSQLELPFTE